MAEKEPKLVAIKLKPNVVETPAKRTLSVNGQEFKLRSDAVSEVPEWLLQHLGDGYVVAPKEEVTNPNASKAKAGDPPKSKK